MPDDFPLDNDDFLNWIPNLSDEARKRFETARAALGDTPRAEILRHALVRLERHIEAQTGNSSPPPEFDI